MTIDLYKIIYSNTKITNNKVLTVTMLYNLKFFSITSLKVYESHQQKSKFSIVVTCPPIGIFFP